MALVMVGLLYLLISVFAAMFLMLATDDLRLLKSFFRRKLTDDEEWTVYIILSLLWWITVPVSIVLCIWIFGKFLHRNISSLVKDSPFRRPTKEEEFKNYG